MQDLTATVTYDQGQLYIYSITLTEQPIYQRRGCSASLCCLPPRTPHCCPCLPMGSGRCPPPRCAQPLALAGITLLACLPLFSNHLYFGHDLEFFTCSASPPWLRSCPTDSSRCG